jgi:uncharacterized protein
MKKLCVVLVLLPWTYQASAASFDCKKAGSAIEKAICANPGLDRLDESLGMYYAAAQDRVPSAKSCMRADQRAWLLNERNKCKDDACLERAYMNRLAELDGLQPGATAIRYVELPAVPRLVTILPPAEDTVAAPYVKDLQPLVVRGSIEDKTAGGDGLVITSGAKHHVVTLLMFQDRATEELQDYLKAAKGGSFEIRGFREQGAAGDRAFAPSRCRFVYRLP